MVSYLENRLTSKQIFFLFFLFAIFFHLDKVILGPYAPIRMHDTFESEFGRYLGLGNLILDYGFLTWYPNMAGGMPSYAFHFGPTYLMVLLSTVFPLWLIYHFQVILLMTLAGYGMCRFIQVFTDIPQKFALLGGLLFALNSQLQLSALPPAPFNFMFPFFFLCLHNRPNVSPGTTTLASRFFWLMLFAWWSYPILTIAYPVLHLVLIFVITSFKKASRKQWFLQFWLYWIGYSLLFVPSVYTLLDYIPFQHRLYPEAINPSIPAIKYVYGFLEYIWYDVYARVSIKALLFPFLIASIPLIITSREVRRYAYLLFFIMILPGISGSDLSGLYAGTFIEKIETRLTIYLVPFCMTLYGVVAVKALSQQPGKIRLLCISLAIGSLLYLYNLDNNCCALSEQIAPTLKLLNALVTVGLFLYAEPAFFAAMASTSSEGMRRKTAWILVLIILIGTLATSRFLRFITMDNKIYKRHFESHSVFRDMADEPKPFRVAMIGNRPAIVETYGLEYIGGRGPLFNRYYKDYFKLLVSPQLMRDPEEKIFFETYNYELYLQVGDQPHPEFKYNLSLSVGDWNLPLLMAANVKYVISNRIIGGMNQFSASVRINDGEWYSPNSSWALKPWEIADRIISSIELMRIGPVGRRREPVRYFIYEMKDYLQRAYLASGVTIFSTRKEVLEALGEANFKDLESRAFLAKEDAGGIGDFPTNGENQLKTPERMEFLTYEPDRMTMQTTTHGSRMLIVSNNYDPKWKAFVNGKETKIIRANHAFQGILLPGSGKSRIELIYSDPVLPWLFIVIPFGVLLIFAATRLIEKPSSQM